MRPAEATRQQLDPVGTLPARTLSILLAGGALAYGIAMTARTADQTNNWLLAILALVWLAGASVTVWMASSPSRAPFTASSHIVVHLLALGSIALSVASQWGHNNLIQDDFGPISLGLLMLAMGVYRPARELASIGMMSAIFVGFLTLLEVPTFSTSAPAVAFVLVGMTPILALSFASASYSGSLVRELEAWQRHAARSVATSTSQLTGGIAKSVRQDRVTILDRDVFPFFNSIVGRKTITDEDRARAREIAKAIRALMVAEADRSWLEVVAGDDGVPPELMHRSVVDAEGRASAMVADQRAILRALVNAIKDEPSMVAGSLKITVTGKSNVSRGHLVATLMDDGNDPVQMFAPYFAVMRIVFSDVYVEYRDHKLTVRFSYEQR